MKAALGVRFAVFDVLSIGFICLMAGENAISILREQPG
jgi:hypothetical protein